MTDATIDDDVIAAALGETADTLRRSVVDGVWRQASVSQLKTANLCLLKWFYDKVERRPRKPPSAGLKIGLAGHAEVEHYLKTGQRALGKWSTAGLPFLPAPLTIAPGILVEHRFDGQKKGAPFNPATALLKAGGVPLDGYMDIVNGRFLPSGGLFHDRVYLPARTLLITDHKFSKNIEPADAGGYAAIPEHLVDVRFEHGIQMIGYAEWARLMLQAGKFPAFDRVVLEHLYYVNGTGPTKTPNCRPVWTTVDLATVEKEWFKVNSLARSVIDVAKEKDALKVPYDENACGEYGGCDFANICPRSPLNRYMYEPGKEEDKMSILDSMFGPVVPGAPPAPGAFPPPPPPAPMQAQAPAFVPPPPPAPPVAAVPPAPPPTPIGMPAPEVTAPIGWTTVAAATVGNVYFIQAVGKPLKFLGRDSVGVPYFGDGIAQPMPMHDTTQVFPIAQPPAPVLAPPGGATAGLGADGRPIPAVLPTDATPSNTLTSSEPTKVAPVAPADDTAAKAAKAAEKAAKKAAKEAAKAAQPAPLPAPDAAFVAQSAATLGIPPAALAPQYTPAFPTGIQAPAIAPPAPTNPQIGLNTPTDFRGIRLFVGCRPDAGASRLDDYINDLKGKLCAKYSVKDPRIAVRDGTGAKDKDHPLAFDGWKGILSSVVALAPPPPGAYYYLGGNDFGAVVVPALIALLPPENVARAG